MNRATGRESTPTRRSWTSVSRPQTSTSGTARAKSPMKWPKRPTTLTASTVLRPIRSITGLNYDATLYDATLYEKDRPQDRRSEEHTSELQSRSDLVCRLLLEKKKNKKKQISTRHTNKKQQNTNKQ